MMRIMWFTHVPLPVVQARLGWPPSSVRAGWIGTLFNKLRQDESLEFAIVTALPGVPDMDFVHEGVRYFLVGQPRRFSPFKLRQNDLEKCVRYVNEFRPDIVHIHGTERSYGLLKSRNMITSPTVISIQGVLGACARYSSNFGALTPWSIVKSTRLIELLAGLGIIWNYLDIRKAAVREAEILSGTGAFLGRTQWDRAYITASNRNAAYWHVGEILRDEFYGRVWNIETCNKHTVIFTNAGHPRRGTEVLLEAIVLLKEEFPDVQLRLAGGISNRSGYGRALRRKIEKLGIQHNVELLGFLDAESLGNELTRAHVFALASFVENSPNSLAEAMIVGVPSVATCVGGVPEMLLGGEAGVLFPAGDPVMAADSIRKIFLDKEFAVKISDKARIEAQERHAPERVINQLLKAYNDQLDSSI